MSSPRTTPSGSLPDAVRATGVRAIREMREFGNHSPADGATMECPREYLRSVAALHDHLRDALLTVDSMLTAGASPGSIHAVIEKAVSE